MGILELDRYITGDYGEDQLREWGEESSKEFSEGVEARRANLPISACPYERSGCGDWLYGWHDEDMSQRRPGDQDED